MYQLWNTHSFLTITNVFLIWEPAFIKSETSMNIDEEEVFIDDFATPENANDKDYCPSVT